MTMADEMKVLSKEYYGGLITRKPDNYFDVYAKYLEPIRNEAFDLLELGVFNGVSMLIWREMLPNARIVGLDLFPTPGLLDPLPDRISLVQGDQTRPEDLQLCLDLTPGGKFDIIIDDASHIAAMSRASFDFLFTEGLKDKGLYFIEDFGVSYKVTPQFDGADFAPPPPSTPDDRIFPSHDAGLVGWLKQLVDELEVRADGHAPRPIASCCFWPDVALIEKR